MKFSNASTLRNVTRPFADRLSRGAAPALVVHEEHEHDRDQVETGGDEERAPQSDDLRDGAADDRAERRPEALRRLHEADRLRHPVARRRIGRHRQRQRAVAGEESLERAQREDVPRRA